LKISFKEYFNKSCKIDADNIWQSCIHPFAILLAYFIVRYSKIKPNTITIISLFFGLIAAISNFLSIKYYPVLFIFIAFTLDEVDGKVARMRGMSSPFGKTLDILVDRTTFSVLSLSYIYLLLKTNCLVEAFLLIVYVILYLYLCVVGKNLMVYGFETGRISASSASPEIPEEQNVSDYLKSFLDIKRWFPKRLGSAVIVFILVPLTGLYSEMYIFVIVSLLLTELILPYLNLRFIKKFLSFT
jgi:phosphatidylglycerophosphate synthase